jgi:hypothetical protein
MATGFPSSGKKLEWGLTQKDFVETMLAVELYKGFSNGNRYATADEIAELFLQVMYIDMHPYPDFKSMRMALEKDCGPEGWKKRAHEGFWESIQLIQMFHEAGISPAKAKEGDEQGGSELQELADLLKRKPNDAKRIQLLNPPFPFVTLPDEMVEKIKWHATQTEFVAFVDYAVRFKLVPVKNA